MRLKEIKPEMAVHCKNEKEKKMLLEEAERLGYVWYSTKNKPTERSVSGIGNTIHFYDAGTSSFSADYNKHIAHSCQTGDSVIEFSDLIIPEMSAEEVLQIVKKLEFEFVREYLGLPYGKSLDEMLFDAEPRKIIDMCEKWKADHEKKEPEIETVDICRIIEVLPEGRKRCVHEEDLDIPFDGYERQKTEGILKRYCMEHDGEFIAVHEVVSRVKAVE